jgi:hypothetical protein
VGFKLTLFLDFLLLSGDLQLGLLRLNILIILHEVLRNIRFCDSNCDDLDSRGPEVTVSLQFVLKLFI